MRLREVAALRLSGVTDQQTIADRLGINQSTVSRYFAELDAQWQREALDDTNAEKGRELARLDIMLNAIWPQVEAGKGWAIDRALAIMDRRAKLLGIDAPLKREETHTIISQAAAEEAAKEFSLTPAEVVAEAERIVAERATH